MVWLTAGRVIGILNLPRVHTCVHALCNVKYTVAEFVVVQAFLLSTGRAFEVWLSLDTFPPVADMSCKSRCTTKKRKPLTSLLWHYSGQ